MPRSHDKAQITEQSSHGREGMQAFARKLWAVRRLLATAVVAILAVYFFVNTYPLVLPVVLIALLAVAASGHGNTNNRPSHSTSELEANGLESLSAEYLAAAVSDPLIVFDQNGTIVHANAASITVFGTINSGMSLPLKFRAPEMQELMDAVLSARAISQTLDYIERLPVERVYRVVASSIGHGTGLYVLVFKDQSEARRIDRMRADFIANASHEMRTPLASISGFIETLRGPARNDPAAQEQFLQIMHSQTGRMARLIDDLLSLSRLEMKPYLKPGSRVDVRQVTDSVIASLAPLAKDNGVIVERDFADHLPDIPGDRDELFQVFENLLENACKYGQSGGRVVVSIAQGDDGAEPGIDVTIRDFGPGIPDEHIPRVTERFYRVDVETSRTHKGTGLGLSIVKHILTRHHARLAIESEIGKGAAFTVHLPAN